MFKHWLSLPSSVGRAQKVFTARPHVGSLPPSQLRLVGGSVGPAPGSRWHRQERLGVSVVWAVEGACYERVASPLVGRCERVVPVYLRCTSGISPVNLRCTSGKLPWFRVCSPAGSSVALRGLHKILVAKPPPASL